MINGNFATAFFVSLVFAVFLAAASYLIHDQDFRESFDPTFRRYRGKRATSHTFFLWVLMFAGLFLTVLSMGLFRAKALAVNFSAICFSVSAYMLILLLLRPLLKGIVKPSTLVILCLVPLFSQFGVLNICSAEQAIIEIPVNASVFETILHIWVIGIAVVGLFFIISHFIFRNKISKNSTEFISDNVLAIWEKCKESAGIDKEYRIKLLKSSISATPFTIGATAKTLLVVMPEKEYTEYEYELIFEHELTHAVRGDSGKKLFLSICLAVCWFNPLVWIGIKYCYEDIELACDEFILLDAGDTKRKKYAELILNNAAKNKGITSSLSKNAKSLEYRLSQIVKSRRKLYGVIVVGIMTFSLFMTSGMITFRSAGVRNVGILFINPRITEIISYAMMIVGAVLFACLNGRMVGGSMYYYADYRYPSMKNYNGKSESAEIKMDVHKSDDAANNLKFKWDKNAVISITLVLLVMAAILFWTIKLFKYL